MTKSDFLREISSMSREQLDEFFKKSKVRTKMLYPVVYVQPTITNDKPNNKLNSNKEEKL